MKRARAGAAKYAANLFHPWRTRKEYPMSSAPRCTRQPVPILKAILLPAALAVMILTFCAGGAFAQPDATLGNGVSCRDVGTNAESNGVVASDMDVMDVPSAGECLLLVE